MSTEKVTLSAEQKEAVIASLEDLFTENYMNQIRKCLNNKNHYTVGGVIGAIVMPDIRRRIESL